MIHVVCSTNTETHSERGREGARYTYSKKKKTDLTTLLATTSSLNTAMTTTTE